MPGYHIDQKTSLTAELEDDCCSYLSAPGIGSPTIVIKSRGKIPAWSGRSYGTICKKYLRFKITTIHLTCLSKKECIKRNYDLLCLLSKLYKWKKVFTLFIISPGQKKHNCSHFITNTLNLVIFSYLLNITQREFLVKHYSKP